MATINFHGDPVHTNGSLPAVGSQAPNFTLTGKDLSHKSLSDFAGKKVLLNIFPSVDTGTCAAAMRKFNQEAANLDNTVVLCISKDLPFAQNRFCAAEGIENVVVLSDFKNAEFADSYGTKLVDGPLEGLHSRAVVVLDEKGQVVYTEHVEEVTSEPNYAKALRELA